MQVPPTSAIMQSFVHEWESRTPMGDASANDFSVDALCSEFEFELQSGKQPSIESYLARVSTSQQAALLKELLRIELWWRRNESPAPFLGDYKARFADQTDAIDAAFSAFNARFPSTAGDLPGQTIGFPDPFATHDPLETFDPEMPLEQKSPSAGDRSGSDSNANCQPDPITTLAEEDQLRIADLCKQYREAWSSSEEEPHLEEYVSEEIGFESRLAIVQELVALDIQIRDQRNRSLTLEDYLSRFPDYRTAVERAYSRTRKSMRGGRQGSTIPTDCQSDSGEIHSNRPSDPSTRYRPTKFHARGGLGAVYRAEDKELKRMVALKEILPEYSLNPRYQEKFVFEAEVTGSLEHPGIVPVYGLGRYSDNQPYYAMRFIRGSSFRSTIEEFHHRHPTPAGGTYFSREFRSLLRRLIETCNTIHYAHQHGVLHRDIKPDNIMLGKYGETLVVDWGLAKLMKDNTRQAATDSEWPLIALSGGSSKTRYGSAVGTPMYMSPEQAFGKHDELDGRTDVYSLGAMLFNIVTGSHPVDGTSSSDVVSKVRNGTIRKLNSVVPAAPAALASICAKAMALDSGDRYATALELADDIDRWISDEVVLAHIGKESMLERTGRLIRRYRSWTISGVAALLMVTAIATVAAFLINRAKEKEEVAKLEATEFKQEAVARYRDSRDAIDTWLIQSSDALEYFPGTQPVREQLLQLAIEDYEKLAKRGSRDPELELERGRVMLRLGDLAQMQQDYSASRSYYEQALAVFDIAPQDRAVATRFESERGNILTRIGISLAAEEKALDAERSLKDAIAMLTSTVNETADSMTRRYLAAAFANQGELFARQQRFDDAATSLEEAVRQYAMLDIASDEKAALGIARSRELLGRLHTQQGDHAKASKYLDDAVQGLLPLVTAQPDHPEFRDSLASAYISLASSFRSRGMEAEQLLALQSSVESYEVLCKALPDVPRYEESLSITLTDLGLTLHEAGENHTAEETLLEAKEILSRLASSFPQVPRFREELAGCLDALGQVYLALHEDPNKAAETLAGAITIYQTLVTEFADRADYFERIAIAQSHYAQALWRQGKSDLARQGFDAAISGLQDLIEAVGDLPKYSSALGHVHYHYAVMLDALNDETARQQFQQARDRWMRIEQSRTAKDAHQLAWLLATCPIEAVRENGVAAIWAGQAVSLSPGNPTYRTTQALISMLGDDLEAATNQLEQARSLRGGVVDRDEFVQAIIDREEGDSEAASEAFRRGAKWMDEHRPYDVDLQLLRQMVEASSAG